jgi:hypothetical protein
MMPFWISLFLLVRCLELGSAQFETGDGAWLCGMQELPDEGRKFRPLGCA